MMHFNGISSTNLNSNLTLLDETIGISTLVQDVKRNDGTLYFATNNGVDYLDETENKVKQISGTFGQIYRFQKFRDRLYAISNGMGLIELKGKNWEYVRENVSYDFRPSGIAQSKKDSSRIYVSHQQGTMSLYFNENIGQFEEESNTGKLSNMNGYFEKKDGTLWVSNSVDGEVFKVIPRYMDGKLDLNDSEYITYSENEGLPQSGVSIGGNEDEDEVRVFAGTEEATYAFNEETQRFEKKKFFFDEFIDWDTPGSRGDRTEDGKRWFNAGSGIMRAEKNKDGEYEFNTDTFKELKNTVIGSIIPEEPKPDGSWVSLVTRTRRCLSV